MTPDHNIPIPMAHGYQPGGVLVRPQRETIGHGSKLLTAIRLDL